jgi:hypothetical protein
MLHRTGPGGVTLTLRGRGVLVPYWAVADPLAAVVGAMTFARPRDWHFSLRNLLVATTVLALSLGLLAWVLKQRFSSGITRKKAVKNLLGSGVGWQLRLRKMGRRQAAQAGRFASTWKVSPRRSTVGH